MRTYLFALIFGLVGCAQPFVVTEGPNVPSEQLRTGQEAYLNCVYAYAVPRWNYDATVYELADAAIGACKKELAAFRVVLMRAKSLSYDNADRLVRGMESDTRGTLISALIDARNAKQPMKAPKLTGT